MCFIPISYNSDIPPPDVINNSATCSKFSQFVSDTIKWVSAGFIAVWGPVDLIASLYLVLPLNVEPTKTWLCHNERYLNLWIRDLPFKLAHLCDLLRYVLPRHFQTTFDDKNGYQHVLLHSSSHTYFGFQWQGFYFIFCTLPFGWKASVFIYHKLFLEVSGAGGSIGVLASQYIDYWHVGQTFTAPLQMTRGPSFQWALAAACVMLLLAHWGGLFYWSWQVTVHSFDLGVFSRFCVWLGASSFSHPPRKKNQVCHISLKTLQCYSGKVISLSLAILGCKLYVPEVFKSTSCHSGSSQGRNSSLETQGQSVGLGEKAGRKFSSTDKRAPGYQLSQNYFQEFRQMPAPDWSQKMLCTIVPNWQTVSPEFFLWVRRWWLLSRQTYPVRSPSLCMQGELLFSTLLTRNERTTNKSKKRLGCYQQEQFNLPGEYSVFDRS